MKKSTFGLHLLIRKSAKGDAQAQEELFTELYQPLFDHILSRFGNALCEQDVEEIVQQTILQIYIHAETFQGAHDASSAWQWAYQIARNQAHKWVRIYQRSMSVWEKVLADSEYESRDESELFDAILLVYEPRSLDDSIEEQVCNLLVLQAARAYLAQLSPREQEILRLRHDEQYTMERIAEVYGVKRARIHQILTAIHLKLRRKLGYI